MIRAKVIADSISTWGQRVLTFEAVFHRFVLAEANTHRAFSRNSASSRAVPVTKMIQRVRDNPAVPLSWPAEQAGMQGGAELEPAKAARAEALWLHAAALAVQQAEEMVRVGVHKSVVNRLLEPFLWHTAIITSTTDGLANFFAQRCSRLAQPEIRAAADAMRSAYDASQPVKVEAGEWHLPYVDPGEDFLPLEIRQKLSAARCARVSYLTHDGRFDQGADLVLFDKLRSADPPHWSPMEHQATPAAVGGRQIGNLTGWTQLRHILSGEAWWVKA